MHAKFICSEINLVEHNYPGTVYFPAIPLPIFSVKKKLLISFRNCYLYYIVVLWRNICFD